MKKSCKKESQNEKTFQQDSFENMPSCSHASIPARSSEAAEPILSRTSTSTDEYEQASTGLSQLSLKEEVREEDALREACAKTPYLDGTYFTVDAAKSNIDGPIFAACKACRPLQIIKGSLSVSSNFTTHLKRKHPDLFEEYQNHKIAKRRRPNDAQQISRRVTCSFKQETFERNVTGYILESLAPLRTVEMPSFRKMFDDLKIKKSGGDLRHLTRYTLSQRIRNACDESISSLRSVLSQTTSYVCTTADVWTGMNRRFMGVTVHWIDETSLHRKSAAIACRRFPGTHSHENIASLLTEIHTSFGLNPQKIIATITDNGSNFVKAFKKFGVDVSETMFAGEISETVELDEHAESFDVDEENFPYDQATWETFEAVEEIRAKLPRHFRCASHTLHLVATADVMRAIKGSVLLNTTHSECLERCTALWRCLRSPKTNEQLRAFLGVALLRPVVTRWNSLYDALKQIVALKDKITDADTNRILGFRTPLKDSDFRYLEEYLLCMKPLAEAIDILQGETYCYYGYLLPTLLSLRRKLSQLQTTNTVQLCLPILRSMITSLEVRFKNIFQVTNEGEMAAIAAVTHPKFKSRWFPCLSEELQNKVREIFIKAASGLVDPTIPHQADVGVPTEDYFDFGEDNAMTGSHELFPNNVTAELEVTRYVKHSSADLNILKEFPLVRKLFVKYNTPLPSSASVERLFSYATMMNLPKYNRLTDAHFEERVLLKANSSKTYL